MRNLKTTLAALLISAGSAWGQGTLSGINKGNMDLKADPAKDFYRYANGAWQDNNPIRPDYSRYGMFEKLDEQNTDRQLEIINGLVNNTFPVESNEQKISVLYRQFTDTVARNKAGIEPLKPYLASIKEANNKSELMLLVSHLQSIGVGGIFFDCGIMVDRENASKYMMGTFQGGISLPSKEYYTSDDSETAAIRKAYQKYVKGLFLLTGVSDNEAEQKKNAVISIENEIAKGNLAPVELRDPVKNFNRVSYADFKKDYPSINWDLFFAMQNYPKFTELNNSQPSALKNVENIINSETLENLRSYVEFKLLSESASYLDDKFNAVAFEFQQAFTGVEEQEKLSLQGVDFVNTCMGMALGKLYVEKYFSGNSKETVIEMVKNIQKALADEIDNLTWMSAETKVKAKEKLGSFYLKVGYPNKWTDYSSLDISESNSLLDNYFNACKFSLDDDIRLHANKTVDKDEWAMTPQTVNAYYSPTTNSINFPAGILQPPFYNADADEAANYGGVGCVIGHEMTHGFDDKGCMFDKDGNLKNWWTESDKLEFDKRTKVLVDHFNSLKIKTGENVNGELTLGENIADNGGIKLAFIALQSVLKNKDLGNKDGFTPEQRFFLAYATVWCSNIRDEEQRRRLRIDPHSPMTLRVNGQLPHCNYWYDAFGVTKKSPLYIAPKKRADIW